MKQSIGILKIILNMGAGLCATQANDPFLACSIVLVIWWYAFQRLDL